jgi:aminoglycoside phosphotransferase (APT) family kinase protein
MMVHDLPAELTRWTGQVSAFERPPQGGYYDVTIVIAERGRFVLKAGRNADRVAELHEECRVLAELHEQAGFVPQPVAHVVRDDTGLFMFTCVEGVNLLDALDDASDVTAASLV